MGKEKRRGIILAFTGAAAVLAIAANLAITAIKYQKAKNAKKKDLAGSMVRVNLSASEILKLAEQIIANSNKVHNSVASVPLDKVGTTRQVVSGAYGNRCGEINVSILERLVQQRHKYARLLGYSCYAEYVIDVRMAKTPKKVFEFLKDISTSLTGLALKELNILKDVKVCTFLLEGKYGHTCVLALQNSALTSSGAHQVSFSESFNILIVSTISYVL
ncbi:Thimet oligopeptidase [Glycine soja]|nr:Thimet oligopeptidase [Glycine soja]